MLFYAAVPSPVLTEHPSRNSLIFKTIRLYQVSGYLRIFLTVRIPCVNDFYKMPVVSVYFYIFTT